MNTEYKEHIEYLIYKYGINEFNENDPLVVMSTIDLRELARVRFEHSSEAEAM